MIINAQLKFHNFYGRSFARVLFLILMKDIRRWLLLKKYVGSSGGCWLWFLIGRRFCLLLVRVLLVVVGSAIYHADITIREVIQYIRLFFRCWLWHLWVISVFLLLRDPWNWTAALLFGRLLSVFGSANIYFEVSCRSWCWNCLLYTSPSPRD